MSSDPSSVISVAELSRSLKRSVEGVAGNRWVDGEIASLKRAASGHVYFALKDTREDASLDCVMYRMDAQRARQHLVEGTQVQIQGQATLWIPRGRLQMTVRALRPVGLGALLVQLEKLKARLKAEGLFERARKRALPKDPRYVGVITSAHGAALHDIRTVSFRRGRVVLVVAPALVQGDGAPDSLLRAMNLLERDPRIEVLIIGRGGGSGDDLMAFNEERVVRRIAGFRVPTVSAVGHEVDITLSDLVADMRAATPSQAAELVVAERAEQEAELKGLARRLMRCARTRLGEDRAALAALQARLSDPRFVIAQQQQELDELCLRMERDARGRLQRRQARLQLLTRRLSALHPRVGVLRSGARVEQLRGRLVAAVQARLREQRAAHAPLLQRLKTGQLSGLDRALNRHKSLDERLQAMSPLSVLARGYAIVRNPDGQVIRRAVQAHLGEELEIVVHEGRLKANVCSVQSEQR